MSNIEIIRKIVNEADPIHLLEIGCPDDEYEQEIHLLAQRVSDLKKSVECAIDVLVQIFEAQFFPDYLQPEIAQSLAEKLYHGLNS